MDTTLTIQLFFFGMAVPVALEAYKARGRARIVLWGVAGLFGLAGFVWPFLKDGLPTVSAKLAELTTNPTAWFALAIAVFFVLRPLWTKPTAINSTEPAQSDNAQVQQLIAEVAKLQEEASSVKEVTVKIENLEITAKQVSEKVTNLRKASEHHDKLTVQNEKGIEGAMLMIGRIQENTLKEHSELWSKTVALEDKLERLVTFTDDLAIKYGEHDNNVRAFLNETTRLGKEIKEHSERTQRSFGTLQQRETLALLEREILERSAILHDRLSAGETYDELEWKEWEAVHRDWLSILRKWIEAARFYHRGLKDAVLQTDDEKYRAEWPIKDSQFPNAEAVRAFKQHRIRQTQWEEIKEIVDSKVRHVAFLGMSESEVSAND